jgi:hypothetical protein
MLQFLTVLLGALLLCGPAFSQYDTGSIAGTVVDQHGGALANAAVTATNEGTSQVHEARANGQGVYVFPSLPAGKYRVEATQPGFATGVVSDIVLHASETVRADVTLKVGARSEVVTVNAQTTTVNTETSDLGASIEERRVNQLPINGRDFTDLIALVPGSVTTGQFGQTSLGGNETSFAGVNILLDGADASRIDVNATSLQLGREAARITRASVDSVAEFRVISGVYSAEYGRSYGDVVNVITKSGTNELHGGIFEFFRNDALDARNFFAVEGEPTPLRLNQFGANLSGPIIKNKLFFFTNYEGNRQIVTNAQLFEVLDTTERGNFVAATLPIVDAIPVGNDANAVAGTPLDSFNGTLRNTLREDTGSVKLDWVATSKDTLSARYNINDSFTLNQYGIATGQIAPVPARSQFLKLSWNRTISPNVLNELGFAVNKTDVSDLGGGGAFSVTTISCFPPCDFGVLPGPGLFASTNREASYQVLDTASIVHGRHTIRFGADIRHNLTDRGLGTQQFLSYASLLDLEKNNSAFALSTLGFPLTKFRNTNWDFFVQDDIRLKSNLTVNIGLRYEFNSVIHDANNTTSNFDFATQTVLPPGQLYKPDRNNFAPRIGFAWDPFKKGKTSVRGGLGIFYNPQLTGAVLSLPGNNNQNISVNILDFFFIPGFDCGGYFLTFPVPNPTPVCTPAAPANVNALETNLRDSYSEHWSLGIQHEVFKNTVLEVSYVGNHGVKLPAGAAFAGLELNPINPATGQRAVNQNFGDERVLGDFLTSKYNAMQVALRRHAGRLTLDANYTWAHEFDNTVSVFGAFENSNNVNGDFSEGDIDVRNVFTADVVYDLPRWNLVPKRVGAGWEVASIIQARSGLPVNIVQNPGTFGFDPTRPDRNTAFSIRPPDYSAPTHQLDSNAFTVVQAGIGDLRRNAARGPGFTQWDFSVIKNTPLTERVSLQFRAEFFDILNHPNFANPDGNLADGPRFGRSTQTINSLVGIGTSRQVQLALKLLF